MNTIIDNNNIEIKDFNKILKSIDFSKLNDDDKKVIYKELLKDKAIKDLKEKILIADNDIQDLINKFIDTFKSLNTKKVYRMYLHNFIDYCNDNNINPLLIKVIEIDLYSSYLFTNNCNHTARNHIATVSSFFNKLVKWNILEKSPCIDIKRPSNINKKDKKIPSDSELELILNYFKEKNKLDLYYSILFTSQEGFRVGLLDNFKINDLYSYSGVSKNKQITGVFENIDSNEINKFIKLKINFNSSSLKVLINRHLKKLADYGLIKNIYSYHDFRHYYSINAYKKDKDIYKLSKKLNHSNINTTTIYLQGLNIM